MRESHQKVLSTLLSKFKEFNPELVTETFSIMAHFAPTLASVPALAGHWVRSILLQTYAEVDDIKILCEAELAARDCLTDEAMSDILHEAFNAGVQFVCKMSPTSALPNHRHIKMGFDEWYGVRPPQGND